MKRNPLVVLAAALCVATPAVLALWLTDECPHPDGEHGYVHDTLEEMQQIADGELARGRRMEPLARDIGRARSRGYHLAMHAEARS